jgi:hypothetical protein
MKFTGDISFICPPVKGILDLLIRRFVKLPVRAYNPALIYNPFPDRVIDHNFNRPGKIGKIPD